MNEWPRTRYRRARILALHAAGKTTAEIVARVKLSPSRVTRTVAEHTRAEVLRLVGQGKAVKAIADELGVKPMKVRRVLAKEQGLFRPRRSDLAGHIEKVDAFFADPKAALDRQYSDSVLWDILFRCKEKLFADPVNARPYIDSVIDLFQYRLQKPRLAPTVRKKLSCMLIQARGLLAGHLRAIKRIEEAEAILLTALKSSADCWACVADLHRRLGILRTFKEEFQGALGHMDIAFGLYSEHAGDCGHDLDRHPLESCLAGRADIYRRLDRLQECLADTQSALKNLNPAAAPGLYLGLLTISASCAAETFPNVDLDTLSSTSSQLVQYVSGSASEASMPRVATNWWAGILCYLNNDPAEGELHLDYVQQDLISLGDGEHIAALVADRARMSATFRGNGEAGKRREVVKTLNGLARDLPPESTFFRSTSSPLYPLSKAVKSKLPWNVVANEIRKLRESCEDPIMPCFYEIADQVVVQS